MKHTGFMSFCYLRCLFADNGWIMMSELEFSIHIQVLSSSESGNADLRIHPQSEFKIVFHTVLQLGRRHPVYTKNYCIYVPRATFYHVLRLRTYLYVLWNILHIYDYYYMLKFSQRNLCLKEENLSRKPYSNIYMWK